MISAKLKEHLDSAGVTYEGHPHPPAYTSLEIAHSVHIPGREMAKSVILKADEEKLVMAVVSANDAANLDVLRKEIGCDRLRLASEAEFGDAFPTCKPGAMPPVGSLFGLPTYCDMNLSRNREIEFNAGSHDETVRMSFDDYKRVADPKIIEFAQPYQSGSQRLAA
jgi:Ala-tRNA(Pro) deacylase